MRKFHFTLIILFIFSIVTPDVVHAGATDLTAAAWTVDGTAAGGTNAAAGDNLTNTTNAAVTSVTISDSGYVTNATGNAISAGSGSIAEINITGSGNSNVAISATGGSAIDDRSTASNVSMTVNNSSSTASTISSTDDWTIWYQRSGAATGGFTLNQGNVAGTTSGTVLNTGTFNPIAINVTAGDVNINNYNGSITSSGNMTTANFGAVGVTTSTASGGDISIINGSSSGTGTIEVTNSSSTSSAIYLRALLDGDITLTNTQGTISSYTSTASGKGTVQILQQGTGSGDVTISNSGSIINNRSAAGGYGLYFDADNGGTTSITNNSSGSITTSTVGAAGIYFGASRNSTIVNNGTITGAGTTGAGGTAVAINHTTGGILNVTNTGTITGAITSTANAAHVFSQTAGTSIGNITLNGTTANTFSFDGGTITGNIDLGDNAGHTVNLSNGTISGSFDMGDTALGTVMVDPTANQTLSLSNPGSTVFTGEQTTLNKTGAGTLNITGNIVDSSGGDNDLTVDIDAGTVNFMESSTVDGGLDVDGGTVDVDDNTLTVKAATDFAASTTLATKIDGATIGSISNGAADIAVTMNNSSIIDVDVNNLNTGTTYTVVNATGASGGANLTAISSNIIVSDNLARYNFTLTKTGDKLTLTPSLVTTGITSPVNDVANDGLSGDSEIFNALNNITSTDRLNSALETLEPDTDTIKTSSMVFQTKAVVPIENRISSWAGQGVASGDEPYSQGVWAQTFFDKSNQKNINGVFGYKSHLYGFALGYDREWSQTNRLFLLGIAYSHLWADIDVNQVSDSINAQGNLVTGYAIFKKDTWVYDLMLSYGVNSYEGKRAVSVGAVNRTAKSDFYGYQFALDFDISRKIEKKSFNFIPTMGIKHSLLNTDDYNETGAGNANLNVKSDVYQKLFGKVGIVFEKSIEKLGFTFKPQMSFNLLYDLLEEKVNTTATFQGGGSTFVVSGLQPDRELYVAGAEMNIAKKGNMEVNLTYEYSWNKSLKSNYVALKFRFDF